MSLRLLFFVGVVLGVAFLITSSETHYKSPERILFTDLKAITLYDGRERAHRRTPSGPQLECVGGSAGCSSFIPDVVQCHHVGDWQWKCEANMSNEYKFGRFEVVCEDYEYLGDPYILKGSCSLEYNLDLNRMGQKRKHEEGYQQQKVHIQASMSADQQHKGIRASPKVKIEPPDVFLNSNAHGGNILPQPCKCNPIILRPPPRPEETFADWLWGRCGTICVLTKAIVIIIAWTAIVLLLCVVRSRRYKPQP